MIEIALALRRRSFSHANPKPVCWCAMPMKRGPGPRGAAACSEALKAMGPPLMVAEGVTTAFPLVQP